MEQLETTQRERMEETAQGVAGIDKKALLLAVVRTHLLTVWSQVILCQEGVAKHAGRIQQLEEDIREKATPGPRRAYRRD